MTINRDQLRAEAQADIDHTGPNTWAGISATDLLALLDMLDQAETRLQAIQHLVDQADIAGEPTVNCTPVQWALDGVTSPSQ